MKGFDRFEKIVMAIAAALMIFVIVFGFIGCMNEEADSNEGNYINHSKNVKKDPLDFTRLTKIKEPTERFDETMLTTEESDAETIEEDPVEEKHNWIKVIATAYTNAEGENGLWGAVDCKKGEPLIDGKHIASDLSFLPYGTRVYIEGVGERTVVDTCDQIDKVNKMASDRDCEGWIDIYMGNRDQDMDDWGIREVNLYIIEE